MTLKISFLLSCFYFSISGTIDICPQRLKTSVLVFRKVLIFMFLLSFITSQSDAFLVVTSASIRDLSVSPHWQGAIPVLSLAHTQLTTVASLSLLPSCSVAFFPLLGAQIAKDTFSLEIYTFICRSPVEQLLKLLNLSLLLICCLH